MPHVVLFYKSRVTGIFRKGETEDGLRGLLFLQNTIRIHSKKLEKNTFDAIIKEMHVYKNVP